MVIKCSGKYQSWERGEEGPARKEGILNKVGGKASLRRWHVSRLRFRGAE